MYIPLGHSSYKIRKKILRSEPELWGCTSFQAQLCPKMTQLNWTRILFEKAIKILPCTSWAFPWANTKKNFRAGSELWRCAFFQLQIGTQKESGLHNVQHLWRCGPHLWHCGVVVITTAQICSTKHELRFCAGSSPAPGMLKIFDGEDPWWWSRLEIRLNAFCLSTIPQKQFI